MSENKLPKKGKNKNNIAFQRDIPGQLHGFLKEVITNMPLFLRSRSQYAILLPLISILAACSGPAVYELQSAAPAQRQQMSEIYTNVSLRGPTVIVIPGEVMVQGMAASQSLAEELADHAEAELAKANFKVLERADFGALRGDFAQAYGSRDQRSASRLLSKGSYRFARWVLRFDVLKVERHGADWQLRMRYRIFNARTTMEIASGQSEEIIGGREIGADVVSPLLKRLMNKAVFDIDQKYKNLPANAA